MTLVLTSRARALSSARYSRYSRYSRTLTAVTRQVAVSELDCYTTVTLRLHDCYTTVTRQVAVSELDEQNLQAEAIERSRQEVAAKLAAGVHGAGGGDRSAWDLLESSRIGRCLLPCLRCLARVETQLLPVSYEPSDLRPDLQQVAPRGRARWTLRGSARSSTRRSEQSVERSRQRNRQRAYEAAGIPPAQEGSVSPPRGTSPPRDCPPPRSPGARGGAESGLEMVSSARSRGRGGAVSAKGRAQVEPTGSARV